MIDKHNPLEDSLINQPVEMGRQPSTATATAASQVRGLWVAEGGEIAGSDGFLFLFTR